MWHSARLSSGIRCALTMFTALNVHISRAESAGAGECISSCTSDYEQLLAAKGLQTHPLRIGSLDTLCPPYRKAAVCVRRRCTALAERPADMDAAVRLLDMDYVCGNASAAQRLAADYACVSVEVGTGRFACAGDCGKSVDRADYVGGRRAYDCARSRCIGDCLRAKLARCEPAAAAAYYDWQRSLVLNPQRAMDTQWLGSEKEGADWIRSLPAVCKWALMGAHWSEPADVNLASFAVEVNSNNSSQLKKSKVEGACFALLSFIVTFYLGLVNFCTT